MRSIEQIKLKDKKYIIFDMDGTLIDSIGVWNRTDQKIIEEFGDLTLDFDLIQTERETFLRNNQESDIYIMYCQYLIDKYNLSIKDAARLLEIRTAISSEVLENEIDFKPDVTELILNLKALGFTLVLATITTQVQLDIYAKKNKRMLSQMNIYEVFDLITRKEDVKSKKPSPEIYLSIMRHYNAIPEECLVFEDSLSGVMAASTAGIETVNIYDQHSDLERDEIEAIADYRIQNYREFINYVESIYYQGDDAAKQKVKI